ncbi:hypothetical protein B0H14DRAFT_2615488 [Mycena olivaceomarginata]|nr:hypothetical protein B0H14DRAFT_2615488 [Mycena olivaceomarginata]
MSARRRGFCQILIDTLHDVDDDELAHPTNIDGATQFISPNDSMVSFPGRCATVCCATLVRLPSLIVNLVFDFFDSRLHLHRDINPDEVVAYGAAAWAAVLQESERGERSGLRKTDTELLSTRSKTRRVWNEVNRKDHEESDGKRRKRKGKGKLKGKGKKRRATHDSEADEGNDGEREEREGEKKCQSTRDQAPKKRSKSSNLPETELPLKRKADDEGEGDRHQKHKSSSSKSSWSFKLSTSTRKASNRETGQARPKRSGPPGIRRGDPGFNDFTREEESSSDEHWWVVGRDGGTSVSPVKETHQAAIFSSYGSDYVNFSRPIRAPRNSNGLSGNFCCKTGTQRIETE